MPFNIRQMTLDELKTVLQWAIAEGWNPGLYDAEPFYVTDPAGFLLGELDGQPIGSVSAVAYGEHFGFIGLNIVRAEFRGRGYSVDLWDTGMLRLAARNVGLACPVAQQDYYGESGFHLAFQSTQLETIGGGAMPAGLTPLEEVPLQKLAEYDAKRFPVPRPKFLEAWIRQPGTTALGLLRRGRMAGYGVLRQCHVGYKIGPLMANGPAAAETLLQGLLAAAPSASVFLDVPKPNAEAAALAQRFRMRPVAETSWMYTAGPPAVDLRKVFGMTTRGMG
jgi:hypothetical protein